MKSHTLGATLGCLALTGAAFLVAPIAGAQDISVNVLDFTGRAAGTFDLMDLASTAANPISQGECDAGATITFRFTGVDTTRANLYIYQGAMCNDVAIRNDTTDDRCSPLIGPLSTEMRAQPPDQMITVDQLVPCGEGGSGVINIWVLALNNEMSDDVAGAGQKVEFPIAYDFQGPSAPGDFVADGGEATASLSWTGSGDQITEYEIYLDPAGCSGGTVTSTLLSDPPDASALVATIDGTNSSYSLPFPDTVPTPGEAAVAIRAIDRAGNASTLSTVQCVSRFSVTTWWEAYCASSGSEACTGSGGCSASGPARPGAPVGLALLGLALIFALRRGRNR